MERGGWFRSRNTTSGGSKGDVSAAILKRSVPVCVVWKVAWMNWKGGIRRCR